MTAPAAPSPIVRYAPPALAAAVLAASIVIGLTLRFGHGQIDLAVYRIGARAWLDGQALYGRAFPVQGIYLPFTYPPLAAVVLAPLAMLADGGARALMFVISLASLFGTLWLVLTRIRPGLAPTTALTLTLLATAGALQLEPVSETFGFGQLNLLLMFLVTADILVAKPWWPRGMLIGIAAAVKLTPAAFLLYFLVSKRWRDAAVTVVSAAAATALGFALAWNDSVQYWLRGTLGETNRIGAPYFTSNQSWKGVLTRIDPHAPTAAWLLGAILAVVLAAVLMSRLLRAGRPVEAMLVNAIAVLLCSPVSWSHHWVWIAPALLVAFDAIVRGVRPAFTVPATAVVTVVFAIGPHWLLPHRHDRELTWAWWQHPIGDAYWLVAVAVLVGGVACYRPAVREPAAEVTAAV
ncbi:glycosyltransferase 87 family protein [Gordonia sp. PP30]|uniref:glycosyltransferase 87 family protein n=1 Tax=unclassified Gordonia (in: high G+C Gram-positive bacteria) TaxID=2657482 RepID=UPI00200038C8|nr:MULTISPECIES: glycosyltransferase 87 family protein [unclassified Gordonia (in: high G+C Gram-positive bacteria)]UQE74378.1 glycosyltransferase 87 family protein [Gordonia sp. PP30]